MQEANGAALNGNGALRNPNLLPTQSNPVLVELHGMMAAFREHPSGPEAARIKEAVARAVLPCPELSLDQEEAYFDPDRTEVEVRPADGARYIGWDFSLVNSPLDETGRPSTEPTPAPIRIIVDGRGEEEKISLFLLDEELNDAQENPDTMTPAQLQRLMERIMISAEAILDPQRQAYFIRNPHLLTDSRFRNFIGMSMPLPIAESLRGTSDQTAPEPGQQEGVQAIATETESSEPTDLASFIPWLNKLINRHEFAENEIMHAKSIPALLRIFNNPGPVRDNDPDQAKKVKTLLHMIENMLDLPPAVANFVAEAAAKLREIYHLPPVITKPAVDYPQALLEALEREYFFDNIFDDDEPDED